MTLLKKSNVRTILCLIGGLLLATALAIVDFATPLGVASGTNYVLLILATGLTRNLKLVLFFSALSIVLILIGIYTSQDMATHPAIFLTNRITSLIIVTAVSTMVISLIISRKKLTKSYQSAFSIIEGCPQGLLVINNLGIIEYANFQAEKILGYSVGGLKQKNIDLLVPIGQRKDHELFKASYFENPKNVSLGVTQDIYAQKKDKSTFPMEAALTPIMINGKSKILCAITDITDRKKKEYEIASLYRKLKESNEDLSDFSNSASYVLKQTIGKIQNNSRLLKEACQSVLNENGIKKANQLIANTKALRMQIDHLTSYSEISKKRARLKDVDLNEIIKAVVEDLEPLAQDRKAKIRIVEKLPTIYADKDIMYNVFSNLIRNGIIYNKEEKPNIQIGVFSDPLEKSYQNIPHKNGTQHNTIIYIKDNGVGIDEQNIHDIFKLFTRLHSHEEFDSGAGIGLSIVKRILEKQNSSIWVESKLNQGSTFFISL